MPDPEELDNSCCEEETWPEDDEKEAVYDNDGAWLEADIDAMYSGFDCEEE